MSKLLTGTLERYMRRSVILDKEVPISYLVRRLLGLLVGLLRGVSRTRRAVVLGRGARIHVNRKLHLAGGLTRIEDYCVVDCLSSKGIYLGCNVKIGAYSRLIASGSLSVLGIGIRIGDNVGIGEFSYIGGAGGVMIGTNTIVGQYFSVHSENHVFDEPGKLIREQGVTRAGVEIGEDCWIGAKVTVCDGAKVGKHSVIAAGCVVVGQFPDYSLIAGVPARLIRSLKSEPGESVNE